MTHVKSTLRAGIWLLALALAGAANAASRRFEPVLKSPAQQVSVLNGMSIVSASGAHFSAGASFSPESARQGWLLVSVKNTGAQPAVFDAGSITVSAAGKPLVVHGADEIAAKAGSGYWLANKNCINATKTSYSSCMAADSFNKTKGDKPAGQAPAQPTLPRQILPGEVFPSQFLVELPKKSRGEPAVLTVTLRLQGEQLGFEFKESP